MFERLFGQSAAPVLEQATAFHAARHALLAENIVNISTPGYLQKDLDASAFRSELRRRLEKRDRFTAGALDVELEGVGTDDALVFHDGNNRSVEHLMSEHAKNALQHNLAIELLRKQHMLFDLALRERIA